MKTKFQKYIDRRGINGVARFLGEFDSTIKSYKLGVREIPPAKARKFIEMFNGAFTYQDFYDKTEED